MAYGSGKRLPGLAEGRDRPEADVRDQQQNSPLRNCERFIQGPPGMGKRHGGFD